MCTVTVHPGVSRSAGYRPVSGRVSPFNLALVKLSVPVKMSGWIKAAGIVEKAPSVGATLTMAAFSEGELREVRKKETCLFKQHFILL